MSELTASIVQNPYAPSNEPATSKDAAPTPRLFRWRLYLILHLFVTLATGAMTIASRAEYYHHNSLHELIIPWGQFPEAFALAGAPLAYASPIVIILLLVRAGKFGSRFAAAALVEAILMAAHFYALLPAVQ